MLKAIVTGHSRGLGAGMAQALLERGATVLALSRKPNSDLAARFPKTLIEVTIDLANMDSLISWLSHHEIEDFLEGAQSAALVNNAGVVEPIGSADDLNPAEILRTVALNVAGPLALAHAFLRASDGLADRRVVHISSGAGRNPIAGWSVYCATKAALDHHARTIAADLPAGARIESLAPGVLDTDMQGVIRATPKDGFPDLDRFVSMKETNALASPAERGAAIVAHMLSDAFGREILTDARNLG
ncbi:MAG: SDR family oxidoreductase [Salinarimonadaceae bacterium]|nr:MAG: SDR family oxidoreductase [Salinarimonadaceae bacterium]